MHFKRIEAAPREDLLSFLNTQEFPNRTKDVTEVHRKMRECVELVLRYKDEITDVRKTIGDPRELKRVEWRLSQRIFHDVWVDRLHKIVTAADELLIQPESIHQLLGDKDLTFENVKDLDFMNVFQEGPLLIVGSPFYVNYALAFLDLLYDPEAGIKRIFRCEECGIVGLGRPDQKFCKGKCRSASHNKQRDPKANLKAVRRSRKEASRGEGPRKRRRKKARRQKISPKKKK